mgnify:CR=1 FL=1
MKVYTYRILGFVRFINSGGHSELLRISGVIYLENPLDLPVDGRANQVTLEGLVRVHFPRVHRFVLEPSNVKEVLIDSMNHVETLDDSTQEEAIKKLLESPLQISWVKA